MNSRFSSLEVRGFDERLLVILLIFFTLSGFFVFNGFLEWDEGSFLMNAEEFAGESENFEESRPAALSFLVSLVWLFTGESVVAARGLVLLFGAGTVLLFYRLADQEFEKPSIPTAVLAFSPLMIYWSSRVYTDVPALFFLMASLLAYRRNRFLISGLMVSLAATFRYLFLLFAPAILVAAFIDDRELVLEYCSGGLIGALPFLSYSWLGYGGVLSRVRMYVTRVSSWSDSGMFSATLANLSAAGTMLSGLIPLTLIGWRDALTVEKAVLLAYTVFMVLLSGNAFTRYWLAVLPVVILVAYRSSGFRLFAAGSAIMILFSGLALAEEYRIHQSCSGPLNEALDYARGLEGEFVSDSWAVAGYRLDSKVYSPWTSYDKLSRDYDVEYAIVSGELDYRLIETFPGNCRDYYIYDLGDGGR